MAYVLKIFAAEDVSDAERQAADLRFRHALEEALGSADLVAPVLRAYRRLLSQHADQERPWPITDAEQLLVDQWEAAETAAIRAAFGADRYMGDADFELFV
jgi:hypothetical protein